MTIPRLIINKNLLDDVDDFSETLKKEHELIIKIIGDEEISTNIEYRAVDICKNYKIRRSGDIIFMLENDVVVINSNTKQSIEAFYLSVCTYHDYKENIKSFTINGSNEINFENFAHNVKNHNLFRAEIKFSSRDEAESSTAIIFFKENETMSNDKSIKMTISECEALHDY